MARDVHQIRIDSILGGQSKISNFATAEQFLASFAIDPSNRSVGFRASGLLIPALSSDLSTGLNSPPLWLISNPKTTTTVYAYGLSGSVYALNQFTPTTTALSDAGEMSNAKGNGAAYYDNYIYFAKNTTIARYGPLDGTPTFNGDYWSTTLGKTPLVDTTYPTYSPYTSINYPNHVLHRHSNGKLYFGDVVGNKGVLHVIATTKSTVEGDTDNGSNYVELDFGYGLWPTAIESYGGGIVVALLESSTTGLINGSGQTAKLAFWDTVSSSFNSIIFEEFPDTLITALKNVNGILYIVSTNGGTGFRLSRYVGGNVIEEIAYIEDGYAPLAGAIAGSSQRLLFGSQTQIPETGGCVYSYGLQTGAISNALFNVYRTSNTLGVVTSIALTHNGAGLYVNYPLVGWGTTVSDGYISQGGGVASTGLDAPSVFWSQIYKIGSAFKITKIKIPLKDNLGTGDSITPKIYFDEGGRTKTLTAITPANFGTNRQMVVIRPENCTGDHNFFMELRWTGGTQIGVSLPITIEYELLDVDTAYP